MTADLYELQDHAAGWQMPIRVTWINVANAEVTLAEIPLLNIQRQAIDAKLSSVATYSNNRGGTLYWYISIQSLRAIANKSDEPDPERLVRWHLPEPDIEADTDFVNFYCAHTGIPDRLKNPQTVTMILGSLNAFMLKWLVVHGRPINFGWGRLDAFPLRVNWKNAIIGRIFAQRSDPYDIYKERYLKGDYGFFRRSITGNSAWITAYDRESATMRWSVEFTPSKEFHAAAAQREIERKKNPHWKTNYLGQIVKALKEPAMVERLYENVVAYSKETDYPASIFPHGCGPLRPPKGFQPVRSVSSWYQVNLVTAAAAAGHSGFEVVPEDAGVQSLSHLQSAAQDVRNTGPEVDGSGGDDVDPKRLPVLDSPEGEHG